MLRSWLSVMSFAVLAACGASNSTGGPGPGPGTGSAPAPNPAPEGERICSSMGCTSGASVTIRGAGSALPPGEHVMTIDADGAVTTCTFTMPSGDATAHAKCTGSVQLSVGPQSTCKTVHDGEVVGRVCEPIPDRYQMYATIDGTPAQLHLTHRAGGKTLLDRTVAPAYKDHRPNGPHCEPVCRQFAVTWDL